MPTTECPFSDLRSAILASMRYSLDPKAWNDAVKYLRRVLVGPFGYRVDGFWPRGELLPPSGASTRFDFIVPWLIREIAAGSGPMPGIPSMDTQLDLCKVRDWAEATGMSLDMLDQFNWRVDRGKRRSALHEAYAWWAKETAGLFPGAAIGAAADLVQWPDGARIVRLTRPRHFDEEGLAMGHCLRRNLHYYDDVMDGTCVIQSYRDPNGVPRVTWEINIEHQRPGMVQLQGPGNGPIHDPYAADRLAWFLAAHLGMTADDGLTGLWAERIGIERPAAQRSWSFKSEPPIRTVIDLEQPRHVERIVQDRAQDTPRDEPDRDDPWISALGPERSSSLDLDLESLSRDLQMEGGDEIDERGLEDTLREAIDTTEFYLNALQDENLLDVWWESVGEPAIGDDEIEACWELLGRDGTIWIFFLQWSPEEHLLSWGARLAELPPGSLLRHSSQHMRSPALALDAAGFDTSHFERMTAPPDQGIFDDEPLAPRQLQLPALPALPAYTQKPKTRTQQIEGASRFFEVKGQGGQKTKDESPGNVLHRGGEGAMPLRSPEDCLLPHAQYILRHPIED
jgi:hypothetical protein